LGASKIAKRLVKFAAWLVIALLTGGAWIFYYADTPTLAVSLVTLEAPAVAYWTVAILTFTTFTMGGLMREQVCTYMCPWPRIQAAHPGRDDGRGIAHGHLPPGPRRAAGAVPQAR